MYTFVEKKRIDCVLYLHEEKNQIDKFRRAPLDHRRYLGFSYGLKQQYESVMRFVMERRVKWTDTKAKAAPFEDPGSKNPKQ